MSLLNWIKKRTSESEGTQPIESTCKKNKVDEHVESPSTSSQTIPEDIPDCWNLNQLKSFQTDYKWLIVKNKLLGCAVCHKVGTLATFREKNIRLSKVWQDAAVAANGSTKESQQSSLRKKIFEHKNSEAHVIASNIIEQQERGRMKSVVQEMSKSQYLTTERVFRTVYKVAKNQRPFSDVESDILLQELNGLDMGKILHSRKTGADITCHIADNMKISICQSIIRAEQKMSVLIDESTSRSKKTTLVIVIRTFSEEYPGNAYVFNLDLIELESTTSEAITENLLKCWEKHGFDAEYLKRNLICFASDGASVMIGKKSGVATKLKTIFPNILIWHCSNHRLELAVNDVVEEVSGINHFKIFMDKLFSLYHQSPKNQVELETVAAALNTEILRIGRVLSVRWVASSRRAVNAVLHNYTALYQHLEGASRDPRRDTRERSKYEGLSKMLSSEEFVLNLSVMADGLNELADLSEDLQKRHITLGEADKAIRTTIRVLDSMALQPGTKQEEAALCIRRGIFRDVQLHSGKVKGIHPGQFFTSLANNLRNRMTTTVSSNVSAIETLQRENTENYNSLIETTNVLNKKNWPKDENGQVDIRYGDSYVYKFCQRFKIDAEKTVRAFQKFKVDDGESIPEELIPLLKAIETIPISTSECERNFSSMNEICTPLRCSLSTTSIAALLFINTVGPPLSQFKPEKYVRSWLLKGMFLLKLRLLLVPYFIYFP